VIWKVEPRYTQEARDADIEGTIMVTVEISEEGTADTIQIKKRLDPRARPESGRGYRAMAFQTGRERRQTRARGGHD
jgi:hypothetical protein